MRLWVFADAHDCGAALVATAKARGHDAHLFEDPRKPDHGFVFMLMHHHPQVRLLHKRVMAIMAMNPDLVLIPDYRSSNLYDDKLEQARQLAKWMPRTHVFYTPGAAKRYLDIEPHFPMVSKSAEGASSHNVRLLRTPDEARLEIKHAFSDIGIKCRYQQVQRGYLMWQRFIEGNDGDIRIIGVGQQRLLLRRSNRALASSSTTARHVVVLNDELRGALALADKFFKEERMHWSAVDLVKDDDGKWYVLESAVGWALDGLEQCAFFARGEPTGIMGNKIWEVLLDEIEVGHMTS